MNIFQIISRYIIRKSFHLSVWTIEQFHDIATYEMKAAQLKKMPDGTLGKEIADCLERHGLRLVPGYESHDLKHVLLDFKMTPVDEIRLQAFMLGNGNYSIASFVIFLFGALFLPDKWSTFYRDYINGRHSKPIISWTIEDYANCQIDTLREIVRNYSPSPNPHFSDASITRLGSYTAITVGVFGMLFCLPFLFSSSIADLVGAGFPFVGGAIIATGGLLALSNSVRKKEASGRLICE